MRCSMAEPAPSTTAQRVAAYRLGFERLAAPFGNPTADERLAADAAASTTYEPSEAMARYLRGRTAAFDRVVVNALERDVTQVAVIGAGYDGRCLRYAKAGVRWFEVDREATLSDKQQRLQRLGIETEHVSFLAHDLAQPGLPARLVAAGWEPDALSLMVCEGVAVYLERAVLENLLVELRSLATVGTRLAVSFSTAASGPDHAARRQQFRTTVAAVGEPAGNTLDSGHADALLTAARWRPVALSERARKFGFVVGAPLWEPSEESAPPTASRIGRYLERTFFRRGIDDLGEHLTGTYGIEVTGIRPLDVGVFRIKISGRDAWIARVFPAGRPLDAATGDAEVLAALERADFPAERLAHPEPVSVLDGQAVLVTGFQSGKVPTATRATFRTLGDLLGRLETLLDAPL